MKRPIVINIKNLVDNLTITDTVQGRLELEVEITETLNRAIDLVKSSKKETKKGSGKASPIELYYNSRLKTEHLAHLERIDLGDQMREMIQKRKLASQTLIQDAQQFLDDSPKGLFLKHLLEFVTS